ncbi:hypothetical protein FRC00_007003 [Tulasnella sp. 408]|nr:hypothetical protein FRC00_007003 [Tulasnella sp. 408]
MSTYFGPDGQRRTFFQTSSWGNEPTSWNMKRRVEVNFYGRSVHVYGPPQAQLDNRLGRIQITLDGVFMETIDLETKYRESNDEPWNPQSLYYWEWGNGDDAHVLEISLLDSATGFWKWHPIRGFGFDSIVYTSMEPWRPPKYELSSSEKLDDVKIHDTNFVTSFSPASAWKKTISDISSSEGIRTFHGTSNELVDWDRSWYTDVQRWRFMVHRLPNFKLLLQEDFAMVTYKYVNGATANTSTHIKRI